jgi:hypothetical protein
MTAAVCLLALAAGVVACVVYLSTAGTFTSPLAPAVRTHTVSHEGLSSLPLAARGPISAALGADSPSYRVSAYHGGFEAASPAQHLRSAFSRSGVSVSAGSTRIGLSLRAAGYGSSLTALGNVAPRLRANRVLYARGVLSEWYANGPLGVEQGFTLARALPGHATGPLTLSMALSGNTHAALSAGGQSVTLSRARETMLSYGGLSATDARGHMLHSWLALRGGLLLLRVDTKGARYPLRIDPLLQEAELTASDGEKGDSFGNAVAVSGDTIVVGAWQYKDGKYGYPGKAYVFERPSSGWGNATQTTELTASNAKAEDLFGKSVAVSGTTVVVGAPEQDTSNPERDQGAAYVYVKPSSGWPTSMTQTAELIGTDSRILSGFGESVAVAGDTVVIGAEGHTESSDAGGAAYVYEKPALGWEDASTQNAELTVKEPWAGYYFESVAISGDTITAGVPFRDRYGTSEPLPGVAYVFEKPASGPWLSAYQTAELTASNGVAGDDFGSSVAASGGTVVVGAPFHEASGDPRQGAAYVFEKPASGPWLSTTQKAELTESDGIDGFSEDFANSLAIAGKTIVVGDPTHYSHTLERAVGSADVFEEPAGGWASETQDSELIPSLEPGAEIGYAVAATDEEGGVEVEPTIVGGSEGTKVGSNFEQGEAFVFGNPLSKPPVETPPSEPPAGKTFSGPSSGSTSPSTAGGSGSSPSPAAPNPQADKTPPVPDAQLVSTSLTASSSGTVTVKLTCPAGESSCIGTLTLSAPSAGTATHHPKKKKAVVLTLAAGSFTVLGGQVVTVELHLSAKARALLAKSHLLHAQAKLLAHDLAGAIHTTLSTVTIRLAKAKHGHRGGS